ncbi:family 10 glycosylhydrolase, partial [bacterium]|nr:family 10 glycosylhydrolase [bacterium]
MNIVFDCVKFFIKYLIVLLLIVSFQSCSSKEANLSEVKGYFAKDYSQNTEKIESNNLKKYSHENREDQGAFWQDEDNEQKTLNNEGNYIESAEKTDGGMLSSERVKVVESHLEEKSDFHFAAEDGVPDQNTTSMIEGKIFKLIEKAYNKRDHEEFLRLYSLFLESFPHSSQKGFLDEKREKFFYREDLEIGKLKEALVEVTYPPAKTLDSLGVYFGKLKDSGIGAVQVNIVQFLGTPVFLFAKLDKQQGYFFETSSGHLVDNLLNKIAAMAHSNDLKLYASFPLRNHPSISDQSTFLLDESWSAIQNRTTPNLKLDLLNPNSQVFLRDLISSLMASDIDGIVFKDDFTYEMNEGFSEVARDRYTTATGHSIHFNKMFVPVKSSGKQHYEILADKEFHDVAIWRTREIKQLLWELVSEIKRAKNSISVGIEVTPEMLLDSHKSVKWYATGLHYLKDLKVDFFIL